MNARQAEPIRAIEYPTAERMVEDMLPGALLLSEPNEAGEQMLGIICPCGCAQVSAVIVARGFKPALDVAAGQQTFELSGPLGALTLDPFVVMEVCGWVGRLRLGYWEAG